MTDERQRIDKWLWFARVVKSRTLGQKLATSGRIRINREKNDSASRLLKPGDTLTITFDGTVKILRVVAPGTRRGPASEAQALYEDLSPPPDPNRTMAPERDVSIRPTKRGRRAILALRRPPKGFSDSDD